MRKMKLAEVLPFCGPTQAMNLKPLAEMFGVKLVDFHIGHFVTYQNRRGNEVDLLTIDCEVGTLLHLLEDLGLGEEIRKVYRSSAGAKDRRHPWNGFPAEIKPMPRSLSCGCNRAALPLREFPSWRPYEISLCF